jgi:GNAT superfamily N-acetyltransferase
VSLPENYRQALISVYWENPCQVLPSALWKSLPWIEQFETSFKIESGSVTQLMAWNQGRLMLYWQRDRYSDEWLFENSPAIEFALLHQDFISLLKFEKFNKKQSYFRLIQKMAAVPDSELPEGFRFAIANPFKEAQAIANLVGACYEDIHPTSETVCGWAAHPVFAADLWVWIIDEARDTPAALGIAEFDPQIAEGSLEWIQVLPEYRSQGLGKYLVSELLNRLKERAEFTTVAGLVDNQTHPERLYRRCGFTGNDIWWVLQR